MSMNEAGGHAESDSAPEAVDKPLTLTELKWLRLWRKDDAYTPAPSMNPVHECFTDDQLQLLGPFLKCSEPPTDTSLVQILEHHPVRVARPGSNYERFTLETLIQYCSRIGSGWNVLKSAAEDRLVEMHDL